MASKQILAAVTAIWCVGAASAAPAKNPLDQQAEISIETETARKMAEYRKAMEEASQGLSLPALVSVSIGESGAQAQVIYPSGMPRMVRVGDTLQADTTVLSIELYGVTVRANSKRVALPFYSEKSENAADNSPFVPYQQVATGIGTRVPAPMPAPAAAAAARASAPVDQVAPIPVKPTN